MMQYGKTSIPDNFFADSAEDKKTFIELITKYGFRGDKEQAWERYAKKPIHREPTEQKPKEKHGSSFKSSKKGAKSK